MTFLRGLIMCLMVGTTLQAVAGTDAFPNLPAGATVPPFRLGGLSTVISIGTFSQIFHYGLPLLVAPIKDKSKVGSMVLGGLCTTFLMFTLLGSVMVGYFGMNTLDAANLVWDHYTAGYSGKLPAWVNRLCELVMLFPALDVISVYPMNAITLCNGIMATVYKERTPKMEADPIVRRCFRLLACVPPLTFAYFIFHIGDVLSLTGCIGLLIALVFPSTLQLASTRDCQRRGITTKTCFSSCASGQVCAAAICGVGGLAFIFVVGQTISELYY